MQTYQTLRGCDAYNSTYLHTYWKRKIYSASVQILCVLFQKQRQRKTAIQKSTSMAAEDRSQAVALMTLEKMSSEGSASGAGDSEGDSCDLNVIQLTHRLHWKVHRGQEIY